jgi:hypothetical protein
VSAALIQVLFPGPAVMSESAWGRYQVAVFSFLIRRREQALDFLGLPRFWEAKGVGAGMSVVFVTSLANEPGRRPRRFPTGRTCAASHCETRLSIYNESDYCSLHLQSVTRVRGKRAV